MSRKIYFVFVFFGTIFICNGLNCRSEGGPKENELKSIYRTCLKRQEMRNSSDHRRHSDDNEFQRPTRNRNEFHAGNRYDRNDEERIHNRGQANRNRDDDTRQKHDGMRSMNDHIGSEYDSIGAGYDDNNNRDTKMEGRHHNFGLNYDGHASRYDSFKNYDNERDKNGFGRDDYLSNKDDFQQSNEFTNNQRHNNNYGIYSNQPVRRIKREKRKEMNSGNRSQYNPNIPKNRSSWRDDGQDDDNNDENYSKRGFDSKACALHCFLEELQMVGDDGMPDRYLVTHVITKDIRNEDLRDFLQESIEDCFQMLYNENSEDRCKFSHDLLMCLSEKGRANCDDWKEDLKF